MQSQISPLELLKYTQVKNFGRPWLSTSLMTCHQDDDDDWVDIHSHCRIVRMDIRPYLITDVLLFAVFSLLSVVNVTYCMNVVSLVCNVFCLCIIKQVTNYLCLRCSFITWFISDSCPSGAMPYNTNCMTVTFLREVVESWRHVYSRSL